MTRPITADAGDAGTAPIVPRREPHRLWSSAALFSGCVLLVNGLCGERGLTETLHARRAYAVAAEDLSRIKRENGELRDMVRRLRNDPLMIESVARAQLGLMRPGEIVVTIRNIE
jgi:cell division protein FtsB